MSDNQLLIRPAKQPAAVLSDVVLSTVVRSTVPSTQAGAHPTTPFGADRVHDLVSSRFAAAVNPSASAAWGSPIVGGMRGGNRPRLVELGGTDVAVRTVTRAAHVGAAMRADSTARRGTTASFDGTTAPVLHVVTTPFMTADASASVAPMSMSQGFAPVHRRTHSSSA